MNDDYKKGYADAMGWKTENHLEHWPSAAIGKETLQDALERENRTPPQRTWVGLTDEDCDEVERWVEFKEEGSGRVPNLKLIRYIEAKLREKNERTI